MTIKELDLLDSLQKELSQIQKENSIKCKYSIVVKIPEYDLNYTLLSSSLDDNLDESNKYTICYGSLLKLTTNIITSLEEYYCTTWEDLRTISIYLVSHPEIFNNKQLESTDLLDHPETCFIVDDVDKYLNEHSNYDATSLYDKYSF